MRAEESRALTSILARACVALAVILLFAAPASAQWRVGGFAGGEHDSSWDEFLVLGADARGTALGTNNLEFNPRFSYFLRDLTTRFQADFNLIKRLDIGSDNRLEPFIGTGVAFERISFEGFDETESAFGFNYILGATLKTAGNFQPFAQFVYTVLNDSPNNAVVSVGVHYKLSR